LSGIDLGFTRTRSGIGESTLTTFPVFDSLGEQVLVRMHAVLESKSPTATTYRYYFESSQDSDLDVNLSTGVFTLNESGEIAGDSTAEISIDREATAAKNMVVTASFDRWVRWFWHDSPIRLAWSKTAVERCLKASAPDRLRSRFPVRRALEVFDPERSNCRTRTSVEVWSN
jgi:hypothetical protein